MNKNRSYGEDKRTSLLYRLMLADSARQTEAVYGRLIDRMYQRHKNWYVVEEKLTIGLGAMP